MFELLFSYLKLKVAYLILLMSYLEMASYQLNVIALHFIILPEVSRNFYKMVLIQFLGTQNQWHNNIAMELKTTEPLVHISLIEIDINTEEVQHVYASHLLHHSSF